MKARVLLITKKSCNMDNKTNDVQWIITTEDRAKHDAQFMQQNPVGGYLTGEQVKAFFLQSGLPKEKLAVIWKLANVSKETRMDRKEFSIAMHLIKKSLLGFDLPPSLPPSLLIDPPACLPLMGNFGLSPAPGYLSGSRISLSPMPQMVPLNSMSTVGGSPFNVISFGSPSFQSPSPVPLQPMPTSATVFNTTKPLSSTTTNWAMTQSDRQKYQQIFNSNDTSRKGYLTGLEAKALLSQSRVSNSVLAQIWYLSDRDKDGNLFPDEFCVAMHLTELARKGKTLPATLPPELLTTSCSRVRRMSGPSGSSSSLGFNHENSISLHGSGTLPPAKSEGFGDLLGGLGFGSFDSIPASNMKSEEPAQPPKIVTFEDKRKENFEKGQAELERRRIMLLETQQREKEERIAFEKAEQEKREKHCLEQEMRKQAEIERQREKQRRIEREREEQRIKALEQKEAARRELERQRQMEWERHRRDQLNSEKHVEQRQVDRLKMEVGHLNLELSSHETKKSELHVKIDQTKRSIVEHTASIEAMKSRRDRILSETAEFERELEDYQLKGNFSKQELVKLERQVQAQTPLMSEAYKTISSSHAAKKAAVEHLRKKLSNADVSNSSTRKKIEQQQLLQKDLECQCNKLQSEVRTLQASVETSNRESCSVSSSIQDSLETRTSKQESLTTRSSKQETKALTLNNGLIPSKTNYKEYNILTDSLTEIDWFKSSKPVENNRIKTSSNKSNDQIYSHCENVKKPALPARCTSSEDELETVWEAKKRRGHKSLQKYVALYQFDARQPDELSLKVGDIVLISSDQTNVSDGWLIGSVDGREGWLPEAYVQLATESSSETSLIGGDLGKTNSCGKLESISSVNSTNGSGLFQRSDSSSSNHQLSPANDLHLLMAAPSPTPGQGQNAPSGFYVEAVYPWKAKKANQLTFGKCDIILVLEQQDIWWSGEFNGKVGWFPKSYVRSIETKPVSETNNVLKSEGNPELNVQAARPAVDQVVYNDQQLYDQPTYDQAVHEQPVYEQPVYDQSVYDQSLYDQSVSEQSVYDQIFHKNDGAITAAVETGELCVALYSYSSDEPGDLVFQKGDVIKVLRAETDWWRGSLNGRTGDFPANYVSKMTSSNIPTVNSTSNVSDLVESSPSHNLQLVGKIAQQSTKKPEIASVIADYESKGAEQLNLKVGQLIHVHKKRSSGWWEGELQAKGRRKQIGWFPANHVKLLGGRNVVPLSTPDITSVENITDVSTAIELNIPVNNALSCVASVVEQVVALYDYQSQHEDELTFFKDSVINVISKNDSDWWKGELNGNVGLFPSNYIQPLCNGALQTTSSSSLACTDGSFLSEIEKLRQNRIHELIDTEETYAKDLATGIDVFYKPLLTDKILTEEELNIIFINWKEIKNCNMKLLKAMRVRRKMCGEGKIIHMIGDILCENFVHMGPYIRFCSCQLNSAALLQKKYESDPKFKEAHKKCCQNPRTMGMPLSSYLLKPMQRITKYPLLIEKIFQQTPNDHPDYHNLQEALAKANELCNQVNEGVREKENSDQLEWIQSRVHCEGLAEKLTFNSITNCLGPRKYLHSGTLYKMKNNKELVGILFNDFLLLAQPQKPLGSITSIFSMDIKVNVQFKMYRNPIFLNEIMIKKSSAESESDVAVFHLSHIDKTYSFRAIGTTERDVWVKKIEAASKYYLEIERKKKEKAHSVRKATTVGRLLVVIMEGANLTPGEDGKSDPYCEVSMGMQEHRTKVVTNSLNPKWNASMQFTIKDLNEDVLCITVYDRDLFTPNDFLGRTEVRINDILKETQSSKGPIIKRLLLHEVESGEVVVKLDLQIFETL